MKRIFVLIAFFSAFHANAQKKVFFEIGTGVTNHIVSDEAMSPVTYTGALPTLSLGILKEKKNKKLTELRVPLQYGIIHAKQFKKYSTMKGPLFRADIDYIHLRHTNLIRDTLKGAVFVGASFHTLVSFRYMQQLDNSAIIYDYFNSLGVSAAYSHSFNGRKKRLMHYHRVSIPIISLGTRPDYMNLYNVIDPKGNDPLSDAFSRAKIRSFGSFQRVIIRNSLFYPIRGSNKIGLTYEWQYYGASFNVPIKSAYHSFMFSLLVNI